MVGWIAFEVSLRWVELVKTVKNATGQSLFWSYFDSCSACDSKSFFKGTGFGGGGAYRLREGCVKVARYSFSGSIPLKFDHKPRRQKQSVGKIATTVVLEKDENLLWSVLQRHRSCHSNEMTLLPILLAAVYLGTGNCSTKTIHGSFFPQ